MQAWNVLHVACWKYRTQKWCKKSPSGHHRTTLSGWIRHVLTIGKNLLNSNTSSTCPHNMAEIGSGVWGTPAKFNVFRILASLLQRRGSLEANQTLHDVWLSPALLHYVHIFWGCCRVTEFRHVQFWLSVQVLRSPMLAYIGSITARHSIGVSQTLHCGTTNGVTELSHRVPLYLAGRPSRWASAQILVDEDFRGLHLFCIKRSLIKVTQTDAVHDLWFVMVALCNRADHYIFILFLSFFFFFLLLLFFPRLISAVGDWMFAILWHMVWP